MKIYDMITFHGTEGLRSVRPRQISGGGEGYSADSEKREKIVIGNRLQMN